jgi:hypothetical protein
MPNITRPVTGDSFTVSFTAVCLFAVTSLILLLHTWTHIWFLCVHPPEEGEREGWGMTSPDVVPSAGGRGSRTAGSGRTDAVRLGAPTPVPAGVSPAPDRFPPLQPTFSLHRRRHIDDDDRRLLLSFLEMPGVASKSWNQEEDKANRQDAGNN